MIDAAQRAEPRAGPRGSPTCSLQHLDVDRDMEALAVQLAADDEQQLAEMRASMAAYDAEFETLAAEMAAQEAEMIATMSRDICPYCGRAPEAEQVETASDSRE